jgi:predicted aldo/keto reductase-like oxidoreductase
MDTRDFGFGEISLLGFGLMRLPVKGGPDDIDREAVLAMVDRAIEGGVNYFDTAWMYHGGQSEVMAGEALSRHRRDSYLLATKMPLMMLKSKEDVDRIFNEQLRKCRTDYFDFYLCHNVQELTIGAIDGYGVYDYLVRKREEGAIRHLGFSFHDRADTLRKALDAHDYEFVQIQLNYNDWDNLDSKTLYEILTERKIPVVVMEPVQGGTLAKLSEEAVSILRAADPKASPASWALRFAASLPNVQVVLSGMGEMGQLLDNLATFSPLRPLSEADRGVIKDALFAFRKAANVPCTACRYCMDCPEGVEIPRNLAIFNDYGRLQLSNPPMADFRYQMDAALLPGKQGADSCVSCGNCLTLCPQHIDIPHWLGKAAGILAELRAKGSPFAPPKAG